MIIKNTGKMIACLSVIAILLLPFVPTGSTHATNPTEWPYGGEPDSSRKGYLMKRVPLNFKQEAYFRGAQFIQEAFFEHSQFSSKAVFSDVQFSQVAYFNFTRFSQDTDFIGSQFSKEAYFTNSQFSQEANFVYSHFSKEAYFTHSQFLQAATFIYSRFSKDAIFIDSQFLNIADFASVHFSQQAIFGGSQFSQVAYFRSSHFSKKAYFQHSKFSDKANFSRSQFLDNADFRGSEFSVDAEFGESEFLGMVDFGESEFLGMADFKYSHFSKATDLEESIFLGKIDLENTSFDGDLIIAGTRFEKGLDLRRTNLGKAKIFFDHHTFFPPGTLYVNWSQLKKHLHIAATSCPSYGYIQFFEDADITAFSLKEPPDSLNQAFDKERYDLTEIFYHRLRDNYLAQSDRSSADAVMYELASKRSEFLQEPLWVLYGWFMGWGYKPLRFVLMVFLIVIPFFAFIWYNFFYHRVAPIIGSSLSKKQKRQLEDTSRLKPYDHRLAEYEVNGLARLWHVAYFSTSVLLSIRFKKEWIEQDDRAFLTWVTIEWALGIGLYVLFAVLVRSYQFGYFKGLFGL